MALMPLRQLALRMPLRTLDGHDSEFDFPQHVRVNAAGTTIPKTIAPPSIWALADIMREATKASALLRQHGRFGDAAGFDPQLCKVVRDGASVRLIRQLPQDTQEWQERETARRARQRPPKPTKGAKTRGKKVRAWDGEAAE